MRLEIREAVDPSITSVSVFGADGQLVKPLHPGPSGDGPIYIKNPIVTSFLDELHFWVDVPEGVTEATLFLVLSNPTGNDTVKLTLRPEVSTPVDDLIR